ncbi:hypothetical protein H072_4294 [Dactylellina haptotyla CBS 200.50]|uniref:Ubiquitin 3 binding protein But2 C-terminal domain-containing protein n=1 Tax=Dactylellina haptotyla (strain CBS 200.50) TaxID=1284197 RepID=S8AFZ6_DACHA|nr:hypothetical protein H072_4294 [Dactylellina haptotyla CBS 200.50]
MTRLLILHTLLALAYFSLAAPSSLDTRTTPIKDVVIDSIAYGGTGCPQGSATAQLTADGTSFTVRFKSFTAKLGTDSLLDSRKFCQLNLALSASSGWQYTILAANFTGYASLGPDTKAVHASTLYFSGSTNQTAFSASLSGPAKYAYNIQAASVIGGDIWSPCGVDAGLNIKSELILTGTGSGDIVELGEAGKIVRVFGLDWRKC